ncbi:MAG: Gfo/Idh/MocA family oxidoreductase [Syntrophaceticus sp.]|nr:Gfo/Idh/MocA family oxidoreductase [Syntrophaceticus sp.]MDD3314828.1 Gfo/Idh/MocA family oxidoreductase [Syntrophaceticus sp.]MDD4359619.1 Gfo/Idh/MocA family oxidoreductase [Syntrophaceticus sp.]MDD4783023.1 Gfo/Idh/MocA family oxidoreductase [Syntrophaceticus sp.]HBG23049.1 oxidoreductase [Peptococcaceae bacterium]
MKKINFGIIGCGRIAYKHAEAIKKNEKANLLCVCDVIKERAVDYKDKYGAQNHYTDYHELLKNPDLNVVSICTPSGMHAEMGIAAAKAGKHVIVEKPMAMSLQDADDLIQACEDNGVKLAVCFQNRFNPPVQRLRRALEEGRFGKLTHASAVVRWFRPQDYYDQAPWRGTRANDGGCLMNQSIHNIDLLQWMMGPVESVFGYTANNLRKIECEDVGVAVLKFKSGALGVIEASTTVYPENLEETLNIFGEKGTVVLGGIAVNKIETWKFADSKEENGSLGEHQQEVPNVYGFGHNALIEDFIKAVHSSKEPYVDGREGKKALEVVLGVYNSVRSGEVVKNFSV